MRRRFTRSSLSIVLGILAAMTVVMVWANAAGISTQAHERLDTEAEHISMKIHAGSHHGGAITQERLDDLAPAGRALTLTLPSGEVLNTQSPVPSGGTFSELVPGVGLLVVTDTTSDVARSQVVSLLWILGSALLIGLIAIVFTRRAARRLTEPMERLAQAAERLGSGDTRPNGEHFGVAELDRVAVALDSAGDQIDGLLAEERALTVDASHQLRTPLTALSIRLEEISRSSRESVVRQEAVAALEQVERLTRVVDDLMRTRTSGWRPLPLLQLGLIIDQQVTEWSPAFIAAGRELAATVGPECGGSFPAGAVGQIIAALVENALQHGAGRTSIEVLAIRGGLVVRVADQGTGISLELADHVFERSVSGSGGTGVGLAAARDAASFVGGRLELVRREPALFALFLPSPKDPPPVGPEAESSSAADPDDVGREVVRQG